MYMTFEMGSDFGFQMLDILRMHSREPFLRSVSDLVLLETKHGFPPRREIDLVAFQVPIPHPIVSALSSQSIAFLALAKFLLHPRLLLARGFFFQSLTDRHVWSGQSIFQNVIGVTLLDALHR